MCLKVENHLSDVNEVVAPFELPLFVLNDNRHLTNSQVWFHALMPCVARNLREHVMSKHDVCEDG